MDDATQIDGSTAQPLRGRSLCPKCGIRPKRRGGPYCQPCSNQAQRERRDLQKTSLSRCPSCGKGLPHGGSGCPETKRQSSSRRGRQQINAQWPGYGDLLTDEALLVLAGSHGPHRIPLLRGYPLPSRLFHGLDAALDQRLIREKRDKDVRLCQAVAAVSTGDQREFLELYLVDPNDAKHWAAIPRWKRPIRKGDPDDVLIWKFFTMQRLNMEQAASDAPPWSMASQGAQLPQMFGAIYRLSPQGVRKLCLVMNTFGDALQYGRGLGNVNTKPWEEP